jgi:[ribosomal protein S5]-alanine N-acetyltransferase
VKLDNFDGGRLSGYFLRTPRLGFRHWTDADFPLAWALWGDAKVARLIGGPFTEAEVQARLAREIVQQRDYGVQYWPMFLLEGGEFAGCCGLRPYAASGKVYELGFHLRRDAWGKGLATEAARAVTECAFANLGATALFAGHHPGNTASPKVLAKLGFRYERHELYPPTGLEHPSYFLRADDAAR